MAPKKSGKMGVGKKIRTEPHGAHLKHRSFKFDPDEIRTLDIGGLHYSAVQRGHQPVDPRSCRSHGLLTPTTTMVNDAASTVFDLRELCDQIILQIALQPSSGEDLKSIALVNHAFSFSAQSQIFRHVILDPCRIPSLAAFVATPGPAVVAATALMGRLLSILTTSPHLVRAIRRLSILARPEVLALASSLRPPNLREIRFNFGRTEIRDLIALPSVETVELAALPTSAGFQLHHLETLFSASTLQLEALNFTHVCCSPDSPTSISSVTRIRGSRARIKKLTLKDGPWAAQLTDWLVSPECPFDFRHLVDIEIMMHSTLRSPSPLLPPACMTLTRLAFFGVEPTPPLNLSEFPALVQYETDHAYYKSISTLHSDNTVETIVLHVSVVLYESGYATDTLLEIEPYIIDFPLPALRRFEICIRGPLFEGDPLPFEALSEYFRRLEARGVLGFSLNPE
ncbi:hypothetical protein B0H16DRAFT_1454912 [Mycena metata]|uniref:Uncharacterized protein n=1 Tax=Mycena metata TaxID=1033252 RepID=A0AAD7JGI1_9AGAR|nr:hypothetical protein B0H16DRAFT_1454912 [Mycena metata]